MRPSGTHNSGGESSPVAGTALRVAGGRGRRSGTGGCPGSSSILLSICIFGVSAGGRRILAEMQIGVLDVVGNLNGDREAARAGGIAKSTLMAWLAKGCRSGSGYGVFYASVLSAENRLGAWTEAPDPRRAMGRTQARRDANVGQAHDRSGRPGPGDWRGNGWVGRGLSGAVPKRPTIS